MEAAEPSPVTFKPLDLIGSYQASDGTGYALRLELSEDKKFNCEWRGCLGVYGRANGVWSAEKSVIRFYPRTEVGMLRDYLKTASIVDRDGQAVLILSQDQEFYDKHGPSGLDLRRSNPVLDK